MIDLDELERLAREATPGPWLNGPRVMPEDGCQALQCEEHADIYHEVENENWNIACATFIPEDAEFVAAANPAVVLELVGEVRRLRSALQEIAEWDCLNPPAVGMLHDLPWLKDHVNAALEGDDDG